MSVVNTPAERIALAVAVQKEYFASGFTLDYDFRREQLKRLLSALRE
jgi:hypothetical protein